MKQRIITGILLAIVLVPVVVLPSLFLVFQLLMLVFVVIGSMELIAMFSNEKPFSKWPKYLVVLASIITYLSLILMWGKDGGIQELRLLDIRIEYITILVFTLVSLFGMLVFYEDFDGGDIGKSLTIINYVGLGAAAMTILRFIGVRFIVYVVIICVATDIFAYFFGMNFGKHKMAPKISPKKSWEGAIGGTVMATILGTVFALFYGTFFGDSEYQTLLHNFTNIGSKSVWIQAVILIVVSFSSSIVAQIGDLVASKLKRTYKIKDFGKIFPGHGGILDRFDSTIFVSLFLLGVFMLLRSLFPIV